MRATHGTLDIRKRLADRVRILACAIFFWYFGRKFSTFVALGTLSYDLFHSTETRKSKHTNLLMIPFTTDFT